MHYSRRNWCCPFYRYDERFTVHCEGGSVFRLKDQEIFASFADKYCGDVKGWAQCPIAAALWWLWEKQNEGKGMRP